MYYCMIHFYVVKTMPFAPSPSHHYFYGWYKPSKSEVISDIVLTTLYIYIYYVLLQYTNNFEKAGASVS